MVFSQKRRQQTKQKTIQQNEHFTCFNDLSDEILLMICRYLSPAHIIKAFLNYNDRMFSCISEYHRRLNLAKCSYEDLQYFLKLLINKQLRPSTLILSNSNIPTQIQIFAEELSNFNVSFVHHLSLLECMEDDFDDMDSFLEMFQSLQSLTIIESTLNNNEWEMEYSSIGMLRNLIFENLFNTLIELELNTLDGIVLDKTLSVNNYLKKMTISLEKIDDLLVLLDGLVPNLIVLNVTLCNSRTVKRSPLPRDWPRQYMHHLIEFQLITPENVEFNIEHLKGIVMPLIKVQKFTLNVKQWHTNKQQIIKDDQIDMLIEHFMTQLRYFYCFIQTTNDIDIQMFGNLNKRWPMAYKSLMDNSQKYIYTIPWSFQQLNMSMLAEDDTNSVCLNVRNLTVDVPCKNLFYRFPNVHTLTIMSENNLSRDDCAQFHRLRHLITTNIDIIPFPARNIHTLTLCETNELLTYSIIYSNVQHLSIKTIEGASLTMIRTLVKHFPNIHSLEIQLKLNDEYYENLDVLFNNEHLPYLSLLKTNWIDDDESDIQIWIAANTPLKWRTIPVYGYCNNNCLTICL